MQKNQRFRGAVRRYGARAKTYAGRAKTYAGAYGKDMSKSYGYGYKTGWELQPSLPARIGAGLAATFGFNRGINSRRRCSSSARYYNKTKRY